MNIDACIFDLDGVICDTAKYHYLAWKRLSNELGFDFSIEDNERLKGVSRMDSLNILLEIGEKSLDEETKLELAAKKNSWYVEYISVMKQDEILPGVKDFILNLKENNIKIALGSASKNSMRILKALDIVDLFDCIVDGNRITKAKPSPEVFLKGAEELEVSPEKCVVFEDAAAGVEGAKNANMFAIGVGDASILKKADKIISGFENLTLEILKF
ncbi:beta-phosphoglucomutase [Oceanirhabdus seepicola]|uniref:Beta-phosphoglucomutase n=1 Tax=Oceanirhabdus seepicola TaxID=2828781 RepID=A0A9J6P2Q3_9CLOT|nr:beta-phosphoglucomutase [Oceanirhabdus seepicola]MCM1991042.1 beta-phosphoglucomutase [Oceanirhabdus seepicola]